MARKSKKAPVLTYSWQEYADNVLSGAIVACMQVKQACQRYRDDIKTGAKRGLTFDHEAAERAVDFYQFCPHIKGEWAGQPIILEPWQQFFVANVFGWKRKDGTRRFRTGYLEVARKNGKSSSLAPIGLYMTVADGEPGAEVYSAATTRDQAKLVFDMAASMVSRSKLKTRLGVYKTNIHHLASASKFEPLSADYNSLDGLNIHCAIVDELHAHKTRDLYDVLETATGARRQSLMFSITTAGHDRNSICWEMHSYTEKILEGVIKDDSFFGIIYTLDKDDRWEDEKNWIKPNPNLGVSVKLDDLKTKAAKAKEIPSQLNSFLRKHMNVWTESVTRWITNESWQKCKAAYTQADLKGLTCYGGLDLSTTTDISALVWLFPPDGDRKARLLCRFWIPGDNIADRVRRDRVPYDVWVRQGLITATPGNVIDYAYIMHQIEQDCEAFDVKELAFDRWGATKLIQDLQGIGFERPADNKFTERKLIDFGQGFASMSAPSKEFEKMVLSGDIEHDGNPVLTWMLSNVAIMQDPAGNIKPDKGKSTDRIDGIVAAIMATDRLSRNSGEDDSPTITVF